jgi:hypothetical protein
MQLLSAVDEAQEFGASPRILAERTEHAAGDHRDAAFVDTARGHALMSGIDHDADAAWPQHAVDAIRDLCRELLLNLEAARVTVDDADQLADADDLVGGR